MADTKYDFSGLDEVETEETPKYDFSGIDETPEVSAEISEVTEPSQLEALGRGAVQGATLGFGEEIGAAALTPVQKLMQYIPGTPENIDKQLREQGFKGEAIQEKGMLDTYRELRDVARQREKEVQEAQPGTYMAGEIAGGIAPAVVTGGAGTVAGGVKAIGTQAAKEAIKAGGKKAAQKAILKQVAKGGAKAGAIFGGTTAAGKTEADVTTLEPQELIKAGKEIAAGTVMGAGTGALLPPAIEGAKAVGKGAKVAKEAVKKGAKKVADWIDDMSGELGLLTKESARIASKQAGVTSRKGLQESEKVVQASAEKLSKTLNEITKPKAKKLVSESLKSEEKINVTDLLDENLKKVDDALANFTPDSNEAKVLGNIKAKINNIQNNLLKEAGQDPTLPTKKEAYAKLLAKKQKLDIMAKAGVYEAKAVDNLFNKAAKMKKGWKPDVLDAERIKKDFGLADTDSAVEMLKDVVKLKVTKPVVDKKSGMVKDMPFELQEVVKRYEPKIIEKEGAVILQRGPGVVREGEVLPFRAEELTPPTEMTQQQLYNLSKDIRDISYGQKGLPGKIGTEVTKSVEEKIKSKMPEQVKQKFEKGLGLYKDIYDIEEVIPGLSKAGERMDKDVIVEKAQDYIQKMMDGLDPGQKTRVLESFKERIRRSIPELGDEYIEQIGQQSKLKSLQEIAHKTGNIRVTGTVEAIGVRAGATIGSTIRLTRALKALPKDKIAQFATYAKTRSPKVANFLDNLSKVESDQQKNALIFSASQNPELRDEIGDLFGFKPEKEEK